MKVVVETSFHRPAEAIVQRQPASESPGILPPEPERVPGSGGPSIFLRNTGVADAHSDGLQRKLKNVVQRAKCGRQGYSHVGRRLFVVGSDLVRRKQINRGRFVRPGRDAVAMMFPIDAKSHTVRTPLPCNAVRKMKVSRGAVDRRRISDK